MTTKCAGMNCQSTDGTNHSPECSAEHAAAVAGGRFVKLPRGDALDELRNKWKLVDGDCRESDDGLITYHVDAFDEGYRAALSAKGDE